MMNRFISLLLGSVLVWIAGCDSGRTEVAGQVLARVNGQDISVHQLNRLMALRGKDPVSQSELLDSLVRRELAVQQALALKLDRQPEVMLRLEEARRDALASAWAERQDANKHNAASNNEAARYYSAHPGLFAERKLYRLHELVAEANDVQAAEVPARLNQGQSLPEIRDWMKEQKLRFTEQTVLRVAEQLPIEAVDRLHRARIGQTVAFRLPRSLTLYQVQSTESIPVSWAQAEPMIQAHLVAKRRMQAMEEDMQRLRSQAKIEYPASRAVSTRE